MGLLLTAASHYPPVTSYLPHASFLSSPMSPKKLNVATELYEYKCLAELKISWSYQASDTWHVER